MLIHGADDTTAPVEESQRMAERMAALGKEVRLLVIPDAVHIFNFRQPQQAGIAWEATIEWLGHYLSPVLTASADPPARGASTSAQIPPLTAFAALFGKGVGSHPL